jgi:hypothetical protein
MSNRSISYLLLLTMLILLLQRVKNKERKHAMPLCVGLYPVVLVTNKVRLISADTVAFLFTGLAERYISSYFV